MFYKNIQIMRGVASLLVVFVHLLATAPGIVPWVIQTGSNVIGPAGVDIFFVISGFVVTLSALRTSERDGSVKSGIDFFVKRIVRIYPVYWVVLFFSFMVPSGVELSPDWLPHASLFELMTLTYPYNYKIMAAWTLTYEMFFYSVLAIILILRPNHFIKALMIWLVLEVIMITVTYFVDRNMFGYIPLNPQILQFGAGCLVAIASTKIKLAKGKQSLLLGTFLFVVMCCVNIKIANWEPLVRTLTLTLPCAMLIYGCAATNNTRKIAFEKILLWFGKISFSLYLVHQLTFQTTFYYFKLLGLDKFMGGYFMLLCMLLLSVSLGYTLYHLVERPCLSIIKSRKAQSKILTD